MRSSNRVKNSQKRTQEEEDLKISQNIANQIRNVNKTIEEANTYEENYSTKKTTTLREYTYESIEGSS